MSRRTYVPPGKESTAEVDARVDVVATIRALCCPRCDASLDWVRRDKLESVEMSFRCAPGKRPIAFAFTCLDCGEVLVVVISTRGAWFSPKESAQQIRSAARSRLSEL